MRGKFSFFLIRSFHLKPNKLQEKEIISLVTFCYKALFCHIRTDVFESFFYGPEDEILGQPKQQHQGMLSLYEVSHFASEGEKIL